MEDRIYMCIDLKSFFASVECVERGLDPMKENLVVADPSRGNGAICLAITPAMKKLGIPNRCRIYEIPDNVTITLAEDSQEPLEGNIKQQDSKTISIKITNYSEYTINLIIHPQSE